MAGMYIKRYQLRLETIGPLFIGSGSMLKKKEWVFDKKKRIGIILDEEKLFSYLKKRQLLDSFEAFMIHEEKSLLQWMRNAGIYPKDVEQIEKYRVDCDGIMRANTDKGVQMFLKDAYGKPYVPGSSVKGAIRNVLLAKMIEDNLYPADEIIRKSKEPAKGRPDKKFLSAESRAMEQTCFHTKKLPGTKPWDMVNDVMSGIRVSDSDPLDFERLTMCQKVDVNMDGEERNMPLVRECLKPGTEIKIELDIDTTQTAITVAFIEDAIRAFLRNYNDVFLSKFADEILYEGSILYLGGGVGYHSKTVTSQIFAGEKNQVEMTSNIIDKTLSLTQRNQHKHFRDKRLGVSPHVVKLTEHDDVLCQFGPCRISFDLV